MVDELQFSGKWDFSPAPESTDHISIKSEYQLFIDGKFVKPKKRKYFPTINPASEKKLSSIAEASADDVDKAVESARRAYDGV